MSYAEEVSPYGNPYSLQDENAYAPAGAAATQGYEMSSPYAGANATNSSATAVSTGGAASSNPYANAPSTNDSAQPTPYSTNQQQLQQPAYAPAAAAQTTAKSHDDITSFFAEVDDIKKNLAQYDDNIDRIESLHERSLAEVNDEQLQVINSQMQALVDETSALAKDLRQRIQALLNRSQRDNTKNVQANTVRHQFQASVKRYQGIEAAFRKQYRDRAERQYRTVYPEASESEVNEAVQQIMEDTNPAANNQIFAQALLNSNRRGEAQSALNEVNARHQGIVQIAKTMEELAQLFQDLETMVAEQEAPVQQIEVRAQQAQQDIERGVGETSQAVRHARAARKKKWICLGIVILICAILAGVLGGVLGSR